MAKTTSPQRPSSPGVGVRKRQQIASGNKTMFLWVAGASVIVAFAIVVSIFMIKQIVFTEKILIEKNKTVSTLEKNAETADALDKNVKNLRADKNLTLVRSSASDNNLDVIIDAMPYATDNVAFGSSLQTVLLTGISIDAMSVDPSNSSTSTSGVDTGAVETVGDSRPMTFSFKVTGSSGQLQELLSRLNRSIRPIKIVSLQLESAGPGKLTATVQAATYYQPKKTLDLQQKVVKP